MSEHKKLIDGFVGATQNSVSSKALQEQGSAYSFSVPKDECPKDVYKNIYASSFFQMSNHTGYDNIPAVNSSGQPGLDVGLLNNFIGKVTDNMDKMQNSIINMGEQIKNMRQSSDSNDND